MNHILYREDFYKSLVPPPDGYLLQKTELLMGGEHPGREYEDFCREFGLSTDFSWLDDFMLFRCIIKGPKHVIYTSTVLDTKVDLCKKEFWEEFWKRVLKHDNPKTKRKRIKL